MRNFAYPYFSRSIAEFWRRWHISLSTWFRDYVYIPLGGSKVTKWKKIRNIFIIFLVSGFWHGANWTFIAWGFINACYFLPSMLMKRNRRNTNIAAEGRIFPSIIELTQITFTFFLKVLAWIFFRSASITSAAHYIGGIFSISIFSSPEVLPKKILVIIVIFVLAEWLQRDKEHALQIQKISLWHNIIVRWSLYMAIIIAIYVYGGDQQEFIYFQF